MKGNILKLQPDSDSLCLKMKITELRPQVFPILVTWL